MPSCRHMSAIPLQIRWVGQFNKKARARGLFRDNRYLIHCSASLAQNSNVIFSSVPVFPTSFIIMSEGRLLYLVILLTATSPLG